jgi:hypothetical protein
VLLPWRDEIDFALGPEALVHVRRSRGLRRVAVDAGVVPVRSVPGAPPWQGAVDALRESLPALSRRPALARVVLSSHFVRFTVVPWRDDLRTGAERDAFVRHCFREAYGEAAGHWLIRESREPHGRPSLACAVDAGLAGELEDLFRGTRLRLRAIEPLLMAAFNGHRRGLGTTGCFLLQEKGRLCGASFERGEWRNVLSTRVDEEPASASIVEREVLLLGVPTEAPVFLCIVDGSSPPAIPGSRPVTCLGPALTGLPFAAAPSGCAA